MAWTDPLDPGTVRDNPLEIAAQRAAKAGAECLRSIRWALEYREDVWLDHVYAEARDAFSWAGEAVSDRYCPDCQRPREYHGNGKFYRCNCTASDSDVFERAISLKYSGE